MQRPDFSSRTFDVLRVLEVHDGDTFRFLLDTGFEVAAYPWLRMKDYSCPELSDPSGKGISARDTAKGLLDVHKDTLWVVTYKIPPTALLKQQERYGDSKKSFARYIADVYLDNDLLLGEQLVTLGLAKKGAFEG